MRQLKLALATALVFATMGALALPTGTADAQNGHSPGDGHHYFGDGHRHTRGDGHVHSSARLHSGVLGNSTANLSGANASSIGGQHYFGDGHRHTRGDGHRHVRPPNQGRR